MVSDLLMSEALTDQNKKEKSKSSDSGDDSGQSSMNTGIYSVQYLCLAFSFSGCESVSESSG